MMKERELWDLMREALEIVISTSESTTSAEEVVDNIAAHCLCIDEADTVLVRDVVAGVSRFKPLCEGALQGYCDYMKRNKAEKIPMFLMFYIFVFRYPNLGAERVRELFHRCTSTLRIVEYLEYLLNPEAVVTYSQPLWLKAYGSDFIKRTVMDPLQAMGPQAKVRVVDWFRERGSSAVVAMSNPTDTADSDTKLASALCGSSSPQRPDTAHRSSPAVERGSCVGTLIRHKLPPAEVREMIYTIPEKRPSKIRGAQAGIKGVCAMSSKPPTQPVGFHFHQRITNKDVVHVNESSEKEREEPVEHITPLRQVKSMLNKPVSVRTTTTALRREAHIHQKAKEEEEKALAQKEMQLHDERAFEAWREEQRAKEEELRERVIIQRRLDAMEAEEHVRQAQLQQKKKKQQLHHQMKTELDAQAARKYRKEQRQLQKQHDYVRKFRAVMVNNRKAAEEQLAMDKARMADEVKKESEALRREAQEQAECRKAERATVIQEIRLLRERNRGRQAELAERNRSIVAEEVSEEGLTCMSIQELRSELARAQLRDAEAEEARRQQIRSIRTAEQDEKKRLELLCQLEREKTKQQRRAARVREEARQADARLVQRSAETQRLLQLQDKLQSKRVARRADHVALKESLRQHHNEVLLRAEDSSALEQARWKGQEQGVVNRTTAAQIARAGVLRL